jgi:predicted metal-binding transcription factor (methanogenesis marker protein 9)
MDTDTGTGVLREMVELSCEDYMMNKKVLAEEVLNISESGLQKLMTRADNGAISIKNLRHYAALMGFRVKILMRR